MEVKSLHSVLISSSVSGFFGRDLHVELRAEDAGITRGMILHLFLMCPVVPDHRSSGRMPLISIQHLSQDLSPGLQRL